MKIFDFQNLDAETRKLMLAELEHDRKNSNLYIHPRLNTESHSIYFDLLEEMLRSGTPEVFATKINANSMLKKVELRTAHGCQSVVRVPASAGQLLAEAEFNRYYMRAVCQRAVELGESEVEAYRAKPVLVARETSNALVGKRFRAEELLADLRATNLDVESKSGLARPGSGLSVRLIQK